MNFISSKIPVSGQTAIINTTDTLTGITNQSVTTICSSDSNKVIFFLSHPAKVLAVLKMTDSDGNYNYGILHLLQNRVLLKTEQKITTESICEIETLPEKRSFVLFEKLSENNKILFDKGAYPTKGVFTVLFHQNELCNSEPLYILSNEQNGPSNTTCPIGTNSVFESLGNSKPEHKVMTSYTLAEIDESLTRKLPDMNSSPLDKNNLLLKFTYDSSTSINCFAVSDINMVFVSSTMITLPRLNYDLGGCDAQGNNLSVLLLHRDSESSTNAQNAQKQPEKDVMNKHPMVSKCTFFTQRSMSGTKNPQKIMPKELNSHNSKDSNDSISLSWIKGTVSDDRASSCTEGSIGNINSSTQTFSVSSITNAFHVERSSPSKDIHQVEFSSQLQTDTTERMNSAYEQNHTGSNQPPGSILDINTVLSDNEVMNSQLKVPKIKRIESKANNNFSWSELTSSFSSAVFSGVTTDSFQQRENHSEPEITSISSSDDEDGIGNPSCREKCKTSLRKTHDEKKTRSDDSTLSKELIEVNPRGEKASSVSEVKQIKSMFSERTETKVSTTDEMGVDEKENECSTSEAASQSRPENIPGCNDVNRRRLEEIRKKARNESLEKARYKQLLAKSEKMVMLQIMRRNIQLENEEITKQKRDKERRRSHKQKKKSKKQKEEKERSFFSDKRRHDMKRKAHKKAMKKPPSPDVVKDDLERMNLMKKIMKNSPDVQRPACKVIQSISAPIPTTIEKTHQKEQPLPSEKKTVKDVPEIVGKSSINYLNSKETEMIERAFEAALVTSRSSAQDQQICPVYEDTQVMESDMVSRDPQTTIMHAGREWMSPGFEPHNSFDLHNVGQTRENPIPYPTLYNEHGWTQNTNPWFGSFPPNYTSWMTFGPRLIHQMPFMPPGNFNPFNVNMTFPVPPPYPYYNPLFNNAVSALPSEETNGITILGSHPVPTGIYRTNYQHEYDQL